MGDVALRVVVRAPHRQEAFEATARFIDRLKQRVPIYKWAVAADGARRPCGDPCVTG